MSLIECEDCKGGVSSKANMCPHCGMPTPGFRGVRAVVIGFFLYSLNVLFLLVSIVLVIAAFLEESKGLSGIYVFLGLLGLIQVFKFGKYEY